MVEQKIDKIENTTSDTTGKDITKEVEVNEDDVKLYSIEKLAPSSTPMTVPYLEIYRTNELEYIPYLSPYNVGCSSASSDSSDSSSSTTEENTNIENTNTDENASDTTQNNTTT